MLNAAPANLDIATGVFTMTFSPAFKGPSWFHPVRNFHAINIFFNPLVFPIALFFKPYLVFVVVAFRAISRLWATLCFDRKL